MEPATKTHLSTERGVEGASQKPVPAPPSCVSMKTDKFLMDELGPKSGRPPSPVPSCVSMMSDHSTWDHPNMAGESISSDPSFKTIIISSIFIMVTGILLFLLPTTAFILDILPIIFTSICFKTIIISTIIIIIIGILLPRTAVSLNIFPIIFNSSWPKSGRPPSPVPSCVSMKSDHSTRDRPNMAGESVPSGPRPKSGRPPSPVPSCVSMMSDHSTGDRPNMAGESVPSGPSGLTQTQSPHDNTTSSGGVCEQSLEDPVSLTSGHLNLHPDITNPASQQPQSQLISMTKDEDLLNAIKSHKAAMKRRFEKVNEGQVEGKDKVLLNTIYPELYITEGQSEDVNQEHEIQQLPIGVNDIFKSSDGNIHQIKTVMTKGIAGIGKTMSVQKFILDWADGKTNQDIDFIFVLPFRELNLVRDKEYAFQILLKAFYPELEDPHMYKNCTVLFVFDGLDESRLEVDFSSHNDEEPFDVSTKAPVGKLIEKLVWGELLPSALVWITSQPAAASQIPAKYISQMTEIRGFNDEQKEEYFKKNIPDPDQARSITTHIKTSKSLFIMCHIPVFCWITATVLQDLLLRGIEKIPKTMTEMFSHFVLILTHFQRWKHPPKSQGTQWDPQDIIVKLATLAFTQLMKGNILFYEKDLEECGIEVREASIYSGMCTEIFKEELVITQEKLYCFVHPSIQEFLAAYFVFHSFVNQEEIEDEESSHEEENSEEEETQEDEEFEEEEDPDDVDLFDDEDPWSEFMGEDEGSENEDMSGDEENSEEEETQQDEYEEDLDDVDIFDGEDPSENEDMSGDDHMHREEESCRYGTNLVANDNIPVNRETLVERQTSNGGQTERNLNDDESTENGVKLEDEKTQNVQPTTPDGEALDKEKARETHEAEEMHAPDAYKDNAFQDEEASEKEDTFEDEEPYEDLFENEDALEEESIVENPNHFFTVGKLHHLLKRAVKESMRCKNGKIYLFIRFLMGISLESNQKLLEGLLGQTVCSSESIEKTIQYIKKTLSRGHKSTERCVNLLLCLLEMKDNSLQKDTEQFMRSGQKLSPEQCSTLAYILLASEDTQDEFDLKKYNTTLKGRSILLTAVSGCRKAKLSGCLLPSDGFEGVTFALQSKNSCLRELDFSYSVMEDWETQLVEGLAHRDCKVETLRLVSSGITVVTCEGLSAIRHSKHSCLKDLDLSCNNLNSGMKTLSKWLTHRNCKLENLRLASCGLTSRSYETIKSTLQSKNSFLKELDLSFNALQDSGVMTLSDGLDHQNCKLKTLSLVCCNITGKSGGVFASALQSKHSQLRDLDLSNNDLKDFGLTLFSAALETWGKLETMRLSGCCISDEGCEALASALTSPSSTLMELDLSYNHPGERSMDLLKQCNLNKLSFDYNGPEMLKTGPQKYACELTLDPNTAHVGLSLSEGNRKVTAARKKMPYPDHPERFQDVPQVLCTEGLCGRCYWEVNLSYCEEAEEVEGAIGVAYKCLPRKRKSTGSLIGLNNMSWGLAVGANEDNDDDTRVMFNLFTVPVKSIPAKRLGVYLDWPAGTLSFFSICPDKRTHLHTFCTNFTEPVYPGFMFMSPDLSFTLAKIEA